jgi:hypothetical protein
MMKPQPSKRRELPVWRLWRWAYARHFLWRRRVERDARQAAWTTIAVITGLMCANLISLAIVIGWIAGTSIWDPKYKLQNWQIVLIYLCLVYSNYRRFLVRGDADELIQKFRKQRRRESHPDNMKLLWYALGSIAAPLVLSVIGLVFHLH